MRIKTQEEKIACSHCGSFDTLRKGVREVRWGKRQIYSCNNCLRRFSLGISKKQFNAWLIVNAVCLYNKGYSYGEVSEILARKYKMRVGKSSVERWVKEYGLGFLDIRDRIISKYGKDCVIERAFNHSGLIYNFKLHKGKLKEFGKFDGLKNFVSGIVNGVDEKYFSDSERCSQARSSISCKVDVLENSRLNSVIGEMLKIVRSNRQRHALVEDIMLHCDRDSVAVEVPVWYWNKGEGKNICGHIDVLQVKFGKIWILDYKPNAAGENFERVMSQLLNYAWALSYRTGVSLGEIQCAWFDAFRTYSFSPSRVVIGNGDGENHNSGEMRGDAGGNDQIIENKGEIKNG